MYVYMCVRAYVCLSVCLNTLTQKNDSPIVLYEYHGPGSIYHSKNFQDLLLRF